MCFGGKSSSNRQPAPAPAAPAQGATVPDISAQQKLAAVTNSSSANTPPFGSELGTGAPNATPGAQ
jgi:hypothetical protein